MNINDIRYKIGKSYIQDSFENEENEYTKAAYEAIKEVNKRLFDLVPYKVVFVEDDAYQTAKEMRESILATGEVKIYTGYSGHSYLNKEENAIGRAIHDIFAHCVCGCPFTFQGEYNAYLEQRKHYPEWTWKVLFAEIPAQTAAYYYNNDFSYKQRAIEAPQEWLDLCLPLYKDYSKDSILSSFTLAK